MSIETMMDRLWKERVQQIAERSRQKAVKKKYEDEIAALSAFMEQNRADRERLR
jgi:hypothetical protein